ncbi:MAG: SIS domain-containing protein [Clostridium beijerinckii]|jgi:fructoselysine-6-P-deglycase FrlB-like protein|uniref:Sugar isomerase n=1 Tax=Clostridium diolis TaxID=223919 RepID=A0AAV3VVY4_9CLOT|nr:MULTISPECIES: SIS domain-containing protein [Clostridium]ALB44316.1 SIS domain-containing protein [Clostridium beijerinckii NRRL B-598]MCI1476914.1 SIS domain-containing protein [Clostridium beijerinckii]MCI1578308.1 SIS domain-containing protein [Clostridium beijerinckii]MCI1582548.1 SIS domain-containing protein [Clostridium beijerinckii]MCI1621507.1 SIS domain-containing protein [Clostridium beijerinckii]
MNPKQIIKEIKEKQEEIRSVIFVGCGASKAELYPAKYFLENNSKNLRVSHYTANEFNYGTIASLDKTAIVISASLGGSTPETVQANAKAKEYGAHVISLTRAENSALTKDADYVICHRFAESYGAKLEKMGYALELAVEILEQYEGYKDYEDAQVAFSKIYDLADSAAKSAIADAKKFAEAYKNDSMIYLMSSGATAEVAYSTSICLMMEMQWINSGSFHSGEFFHGPFEIVDKDIPFILLMNEGSTRPIDARALTFLKRFEAKTTVVDALDYGLSSVIPKTVIDYFNPMLITAVFRVYAEELSYARQHPLTKRRYMWKLEY